MSSVLELRDFLMQCPFLRVREDSNMPTIYVDYLSENPTTYEIQVIPVSQIVKKYVDGGGIKQKTFVFRSREYYNGRDISQSIDTINFYEQFSSWLEKTKPNIKSWIKVEALTDGYFFDVSESQDKASYQIQCRILYNF